MQNKTLSQHSSSKGRLAPFIFQPWACVLVCVGGAAPSPFSHRPKFGCHWYVCPKGLHKASKLAYGYGLQAGKKYSFHTTKNFKVAVIRCNPWFLAASISTMPFPRHAAHSTCLFQDLLALTFSKINCLSCFQLWTWPCHQYF